MKKVKEYFGYGKVSYKNMNNPEIKAKTDGTATLAAALGLMMTLWEEEGLAAATEEDGLAAAKDEEAFTGDWDGPTALVLTMVHGHSVIVKDVGAVTV